MESRPAAGEEAAKEKRELLRAAHTLKGAAHVVRQPEMARLAHVLEDALNGGVMQASEMLRLVDAMAASLEAMFAASGLEIVAGNKAGLDEDLVSGFVDTVAVKAGHGAGSDAAAPVLQNVDVRAAPVHGETAESPLALNAESTIDARIEAAFESGRVNAMGAEATRTEMTRVETVRVELATTARLLERVSEGGVLVESMRASAASISAITEAAERMRQPLMRGQSVYALPGADAAGVSEHGRRTPSGFDQRDVWDESAGRELHDEGVSDLVGKLDTLRRKWVTQTERLARELEGMREAVMLMRLSPATSLLMSAERVARRTAEEVGREVVCTSFGATERVDLLTLEGVDAAVMHMVRNAVAHGIEPAETRASRGKPAAGRVEIVVERTGSGAAVEVEFRCTDDGAGVDVERVRSVAIERGWMTATAAAHAGKAELLELLQRPGMTTRGEADTVAGRGIGLDMVRATAERMDGSLEIETEAGKGTTVRLRVPLSRFLTLALVLESDGREWAVPLPAVVQTMVLGEHPTSNDINGEFVEIENERIRVLRLRMLSKSPFEDRIADRRGRGARAINAGQSYDTDRVLLLLRHGKKRLGLVVDAARGQLSVIAQPIPSMVQAEEWVSGMYLNGEGVPRLLLDVGGLMRSADIVPAISDRSAPLPVLVIDDSLTSRMLEQSILESAGYEVDLASSAEEGLERAGQRAYGLFLVDVEMPGMNGFEFVQRTRRDEEMQRVPVVMVTSRNLAGDRERGLNSGASGYVVKGDFQQEALLQMIAGLVKRSAVEKRRLV